MAMKRSTVAVARAGGRAGGSPADLLEGGNSVTVRGPRPGQCDPGIASQASVPADAARLPHQGMILRPDLGGVCAYQGVTLKAHTSTQFPIHVPPLAARRGPLRPVPLSQAGSWPLRSITLAGKDISDESRQHPIQAVPVSRQLRRVEPGKVGATGETMAFDLTIDIENTPGALARVAAGADRCARVNIAAATCVGPAQRAELHILVPYAEAAKHVLAISHLAVTREREVVVVDVEGSARGCSPT